MTRYASIPWRGSRLGVRFDASTDEAGDCLSVSGFEDAEGNPLDESELTREEREAVEREAAETLERWRWERKYGRDDD